MFLTQAEYNAGHFLWLRIIGRQFIIFTNKYSTSLFCLLFSFFFTKMKMYFYNFYELQLALRYIAFKVHQQDYVWSKTNKQSFV